jgi:UDP-2-acetamido-2-deoxy-ribo-hexuluronate aminotransferase
MIDLFTLGPIKNELKSLPKYFMSNDTLGGVNNRHIPFLEKKFFDLTSRSASSINSCTNGVYLALKMLNLDNDPVLVSPIIFFGIGSAILKAGGIPVFSDVDQAGLMNLSQNQIDQIENFRLNGKKIKAIIPAHINSRYVEIPSNLSSFAIIEDSAPAFGITKKNGRCLISDSSNISIISFSFAKPLTAGEGGMIFSNSTTADWIKAHRYCGLDKLSGPYGIGTFEVTDPDLKFPFNALAAMLISIKLNSFQIDLLKRRENAQLIESNFKNDLEFYNQGNHLTYVIRLKNKSNLEKKLSERWIGFYSSHKPMYHFEAFKNFHFLSSEAKQNSESYFSEILHIPCRSDLTESEINFILDTIKN